MFGDLLRTYRRRLNMTQEVLAAKAGVGVRSVRAIETGRISIARPSTVRQLADALELDGEEREAFYRASADGRPATETDRPQPAQLPPDVARFAGRTEYLKQLDALLATPGSSPTAVVISAIAGTAGVGKTALAVHWAHAVAHRFPDGQLYVNLRGFDASGSAMSPAEAVRGFLDALGVAPARMPTAFAAQVGLYRSVMAGRRVLVVLDNAREAEQVRPLLPGSPGSLALVTSRNDLSSLVAVDGARPLTLDVLSTAEARELLASRLGAERVAAEPDAVTRMIGACARLPLALAVAAARATGSGFPLTTVAAELADAGRRLDVLDTGDPAGQVRAVLSWSYAALGSAASRLFRLLSLHPGPDISLSAVASLAGEPAAETRRRLRELVHAHLVAEIEPDRFAFHDLLRAHASELTRAQDSREDRRAALVRLLDHYIHNAYTADRRINPHRGEINLPLTTPAPGAVLDDFADPPAATAWLAAERRVLLAVLEAAAGNGFDRHACQLAWSLDTFNGRQSRWHEMAAMGSIALPAARRLRHVGAQGYALRLQSHAAMLLGRPDEAQGHLQRALELYEHDGDTRMQALTHQNLSVAHSVRKDLEAALHHAEQALMLARAGDFAVETVKALNTVGWCYALLGRYTEAIAHCEQSLSGFQQLGEAYGEASAWNALGYANQGNGEHRRAADCYRRAIELWREHGDEFRRADTLDKLGDALEAAGDHEAARVAWQEAFDILSDMDHPSAEGVRAKLPRV